MCLDMRFTPEVEKKMIAELPGGLITVYRWVRRIHGSYVSVMMGHRFRVGLNHAGTSQMASSRYRAGYHSFATLRGARRWWGRTGLIVKFQIRKKWITAIGKDGTLCYVTDRIISPSLRDKSAVVE